MTDLSMNKGLAGEAPSGFPTESTATQVARATVTALVRYGVQHVVVCPGSRSAPLVYALAAAEDAGWLRTHVCLDERSAGFYALGLSLGQVGEAAPVAIVMTSGTAVANVHPAVLEATHAGVPLLVLSADRPHELRGTGANQTTEQVGIYGSAPRFAFDVPSGFAPERVDALMRRAVSAALGVVTGDRGVAHLNLCFAEPLVPASPWIPGEAPQPISWFSSLGESTAAGRLAAGQIDWSECQTVIVAGANAGSEALSLAALTGWPCLAEPSSQARAAGAEGASVLPECPEVPLICDYQAALGLREPSELSQAVRQVIQLGRPTLSRPVSRLLSSEQADLMVLADGAIWADQSASAVTVATPVDAVAVAREWRERADSQTLQQRQDWTERWRQAAAPSAIMPQDKASLAGGLCAQLWRDSAREPVNLVIGASSVIRYFDRFAGSLGIQSAEEKSAGGNPTGLSREPWVRAFANRGLAGIDGTLATARGIARASGLPTRVVVGDLTFLHDAMSLLPSLGAEGEPWGAGLQVIVLNDGGGSIFAGLEHAAAPPELFARFFTTQQSCDLRAFAQAMGLQYREVSLGDALGTSFPIGSGGELVNVMMGASPRQGS